MTALTSRDFERMMKRLLETSRTEPLTAYVHESLRSPELEEVAERNGIPLVYTLDVPPHYIYAMRTDKRVRK